MPRETASISELERLLARQKERLKLLQTRRDRLASRLARVDEQIGSLLGKPPAPRKVPRRRPAGKSLLQHILDVLKAAPQPKSIAEITEAVIQAGYRSTSKDFPSLVRQVCYKSKLIQRKERGRFIAARTSNSPRRRAKRAKRAEKK